MAHYRAYPVGHDDRYTDAINLDCESDEEALMQAADRLGREVPVEVWAGKRYVGRLPVQCGKENGEDRSPGLGAE